SVQISENANLGAASGGLTLNGGTLATTANMVSTRSITLTGTGGFDVASGTTLGLVGTIAGAGDLVKQGGGHLQLSGDSSGFAGTTTTMGGTLLVGNADGAGTLGGSLDILNG